MDWHASPGRLPARGRDCGALIMGKLARELIYWGEAFAGLAIPLGFVFLPIWLPFVAGA